MILTGIYKSSPKMGDVYEFVFMLFFHFIGDLSGIRARLQCYDKTSLLF
jgi:hypothetical protein